MRREDLGCRFAQSRDTLSLHERVAQARLRPQLCGVVRPLPMTMIAVYTRRLALRCKTREWPISLHSPPRPIQQLTVYSQGRTAGVPFARTPAVSHMRTMRLFAFTLACGTCSRSMSPLRIDRRQLRLV